MRNPNYSTVDPKTGSVNYNGPSKIMRGDHSHMPARSHEYEITDHRGHVQGSSLGGVNTRVNVVAQNSDVNSRAYYSMERGERNALKSGASIHSDKTAYVSNQFGGRCDAFLVNDTVKYDNGRVENIHYSFANDSYALQEARNAESVALEETFDAPNPDSLRESMSTQAYADLMEQTDLHLPNIVDDYEPSHFSGATSAEAWNTDITIESDSSANIDSEASVDVSTSDVVADVGDDGGISSDLD